MPGAPLSLPEREEISLALIEDRSTSWAEIARRVHRHPTTVAREVAANGGRIRYRPTTADKSARTNLGRPRSRRLELPGILSDRVTDQLRMGRSPVAIWADLVADEIEDRVCVETIYSAVFAGVLAVKATECLRSRRPRRRHRQVRHLTIRPALPNITARPAVVNDRIELGHWEADQIIGWRNKSSMLWLTSWVGEFHRSVHGPGHDDRCC